MSNAPTPPLFSNWKTTLTGVGSALMSLIAIVAALPYSMGDVADILPPEWKTKVCIAAAIASAVLKVVNGSVAADAKATPESPTAK